MTFGSSRMAQKRRAAAEAAAFPQGIRCQKCLEYGHWSYQCTGKRKYLHRDSRTQLLRKKIRDMENKNQINKLPAEVDEKVQSGENDSKQLKKKVNSKIKSKLKSNGDDDSSTSSSNSSDNSSSDSDSDSNDSDSSSTSSSSTSSSSSSGSSTNSSSSSSS
ncbi:zinc finger CCHC domain-containing protein 10-like [Ctenocephalides felis]|uniref:zinc finger CCHC domain-containing protein 10-like n=1 Tax=Ctenocephalides felis TaxID=7515 RepID=UPI000E6E544F|nr:zinc finger CCHC domain-containing protein 10-like [Ctenocephalides felis]